MPPRGVPGAKRPQPSSTGDPPAKRVKAADAAEVLSPEKPATTENKDAASATATPIPANPKESSLHR